jgi:hypothetical protein
VPASAEKIIRRTVSGIAPDRSDHETGRAYEMRYRRYRQHRVLQEGLAAPTEIEPAADTLWYGEPAADRAHSMPLAQVAADGF